MLFRSAERHADGEATDKELFDAQEASEHVDSKFAASVASSVAFFVAERAAWAAAWDAAKTVSWAAQSHAAEIGAWSESATPFADAWDAEEDERKAQTAKFLEVVG